MVHVPAAPSRLRPCPAAYGWGFVFPLAARGIWRWPLPPLPQAVLLSFLRGTLRRGGGGGGTTHDPEIEGLVFH